MYSDFFGLKEHPFNLNTDPRFLYLSEAHARARAYMEYALLRPDGLIVISGAIGCGKTTLIRDVLSHLDSKVVHARIHHTQLNEIELLQALALEFGLQPGRSSKARLLANLTHFLVAQHEQEQRILLVVDDAQNLGPRALEEVRLLSDVEVNRRQILSTILVGQPRLDETLDSVGLEQLAQRIRLRYRLTAFNREDTRSYMTHRLAVAGNAHNTIFEPPCFPLIYKYTGGVPRLINVLCDVALTAAFVEDSHRVTPDLVGAAIEELQWVPYSRRHEVKRLPERNANDSSLKCTMRHSGGIRDGVGRIMGVIRGGLSLIREKEITSHLSGVMRTGRRYLTWLSHVVARTTKPLSQAWHKRPLTQFGASLMTVVFVSTAVVLTYLKDGSEQLKQETAHASPDVSASTALARRSLQPMKSPTDTNSTIPLKAALPLEWILQEPVIEWDTEIPEPIPVLLAVIEGDASEPGEQTGSGRAQTSMESVEHEPSQSSSEPTTAADEKDGAVNNLEVAVAGAESQGEIHLPTNRCMGSGSDIVDSHLISEISGLRPAQWLLDQDPDAYVVQVLSVRSLAALLRFAIKHQSNQGMATFQTCQHGKEWYAVVVGPYRSFSAAKAAQLTLPSSVRTNRPWIRKLSQVQKHIMAASTRTLFEPSWRQIGLAAQAIY